MSKKIVKKLCDDLDVEYIFKLPKEIQELLFNISGNINSPLAIFYRKFLQYHQYPSYDFFDTVDCPLYRSSDDDDFIKSYYH